MKQFKLTFLLLFISGTFLQAQNAVPPHLLNQSFTSIQEYLGNADMRKLGTLLTHKGQSELFKVLGVGQLTSLEVEDNMRAQGAYLTDGKVTWESTEENRMKATITDEKGSFIYLNFFFVKDRWLLDGWSEVGGY